MSKIGIITICDNDNYGNRLQNYATQEFLKETGLEVETIKNKSFLNDMNKKKLKYYLRKTKNLYIDCKTLFNKRTFYFKTFNKSIKFSKKYYHNWNSNDKKMYDYFVVGSDQVWNPKFARLKNIDLLSFAEPQKRISFSASFGINVIPKEYTKNIKKELSKFSSISVREERGKEIIEELTGRKDVQVLLDPTMLIETEKWESVIKIPKMLNKLNGKKYILNYFLGNLSESRKKEIERIANENDCEIINILDKKDPFYISGPSEFLYLEKNAFLVCTDSFHSCVFAILFNTPFVVFDRDDNKEKMNSRLDTLLRRFKLENHWFNNSIATEQLIENYNKINEILETERKKAKKFIQDALI